MDPVIAKARLVRAQEDTREAIARLEAMFQSAFGDPASRAELAPARLATSSLEGKVDAVGVAMEAFADRLAGIEAKLDELLTMPAPAPPQDAPPAARPRKDR